MRKFLIALLIATGLLAGLTVGAPSVVDWNAHRQEIARQLGAATGRTVVLDGPIRLSLLPVPSLTLADARIANPSTAREPEMIRLKALDVRVALWPLLTGQLEMESVTLVEPTLVVEILPDGRLNWDPTGAPPPTDGTPGSAASSGSGNALGRALSFDQVRVTGGVILYRDGPRRERVEGVEANIVAGSLAGPFQLQGRGLVRGVPVKIELTSGRFSEKTAVPLRLTLGLSESDATLRFAGIFAPADSSGPASGSNRLQGDLRVEGSDFSRLVETLKPAIGLDELEAPAEPFALRAAIETGKGLVTFKSLDIQIDDTRASGQATLRPGATPDLALTLSANRFDLDGWLGRLAANVPHPSPAGEASTPAVEAKRGMSWPSRLSATLKLAVDAVPYRGATMRQLRLDATLAEGALDITRASANLPGGATIRAAGTASVRSPLGLEARFEAEAEDTRALLDWLKVDVRAPPASTLRRARLTGTLTARPRRLQLDGLELTLDGARLKGAIAYAERERPAYGLRLEAERLDLDTWFPAAEGPATADGRGADGRRADGRGADGRAAPAPPLAYLDRLLRANDATLDLRIGELVGRGLNARDLRLDATASGGVLVVREGKVADVAGGKLGVSGRLGGLAPIRDADLALSAQARSLDGVAGWLSWPGVLPPPDRLGPLHLDGRLTGGGERLGVEFTADLAGGRLEAGGTLSGLAVDPNGAFKLRLVHPDLAALGALFAVPALPAGPLDLFAEVAGNEKSARVTKLQGEVAGVALLGQGAFEGGGQRPRVRAELRTGEIDLDRMLEALPPAAPSAALPAAPPTAPPTAQAGGPATAGQDRSRGWLDAIDGTLAVTAATIRVEGLLLERPAFKASLTNGALTLDQLDGGLAGGQIGVTAALTTRGDGPPALEGAVTLVGAHPAGRLALGALGLSADTLDVDASLRAVGADRQALLRSLSGTLAARGENGALEGFDLASLGERLGRAERMPDALEAIQRALSGGHTPYTRLDATATIANGVLRTDDSRLSAPTGTVTAGGEIDLVRRTIDLAVRLAPASPRPLPAPTLYFEGDIAAPVSRLDLHELRDVFIRPPAHPPTP